MSKLEKLLSQYAAYHLDHKNIVTHFVGIPLIVFSIMCLTARAGMTIGSFELTLAMVLILASIVYYLSLDRIFGVIMLVIYAMAYPLASLYTTNFTEPLSYQDSAFLKLPKFP